MCFHAEKLERPKCCLRAIWDTFAPNEASIFFARQSNFLLFQASLRGKRYQLLKYCSLCIITQINHCTLGGKKKKQPAPGRGIMGKWIQKQKNSGINDESLLPSARRTRCQKELILILIWRRLLWSDTKHTYFNLFQTSLLVKPDH